MQQLTSFDALVARLSAAGQRRRIAVVCPYDDGTVEAVCRALDAGFATCLLVGEGARIAHTRLAGHVGGQACIVEAADADAACREAVALVREHRADALMKGLVNTDNLLHAVLNKQTGLLPPGHVLTHLAAAQTPAYHKLLFFSDAAVIPVPTLAQRVEMVRDMAAALRRLGIGEPRIALTHCTEKVSDRFPVTLDYVELRRRAAAGEFGPCVVDGPMDVKTASDAHSAEVKGIASPVAGAADGLIFPDIEAGNTFYKTLSRFAAAEMAGVLEGCAAPVVLSSRSDDAASKYNSIALAAALS